MLLIIQNVLSKMAQWAVEYSKWGVVANFGCQLVWIWSQLKGKFLGTPVRNFLDQII